MFALLAIAHAVQPDRVDIAARLVADGHAERAATVLAEIDTPKRSELGRYHTLRGLVALELGDPKTAAEALSIAIEYEPEPITWVSLAAAHQQLGDPRSVLSDLEQGGPELDALPAAWHLKARARAELGELDLAYQTALQGSERFPAHSGLLLERATELSALGMNHELATALPELLLQSEASEDTWLQIGSQLIDAGALQDAALFGESMILALPDGPRPRVFLATACLNAERWRCAGEQLAQAAAFDPEYAVQAAESFRRAGDPGRALYLNTQVIEPADKARQRLGLLLETRSFAEATALHPRLERLGLLDEDAVAYALAYAWVQTGSPSRAEALITRLTEPAYITQGTALLESLEAP